MPYTLVSAELCPYVERVRILLAAKGVPFETRTVDLKNKPDWFLALSPRGRVPLLSIDGEVVFESSVINELLEELHPEPRLFPREPVARARARSWIVFVNDELMPAFARLWFKPTEQAPALERATLELVAACLAPSRDRADAAASDIAAMTLRRARAHIEARLAEPGLTPAAIGRALGLSRSALYRLFAPFGGIAAYVQGRRLARVRQIVVIPDSGTLGAARAAHVRAIALRQQWQANDAFEMLADPDSNPFAPIEGLQPVEYRRGQGSPFIEQVAFCLPVNEISPPLLAEDGFHLIQVLDAR